MNDADHIRIIRGKMKQLHWGQRDLAKHTGISEAEISRIMRGKRPPYPGEAIKLHGVLAIRLNTLIDVPQKAQGLIRIRNPRQPQTIQEPAA